MMVVMLIVCIVVFVLLVMVASVLPQRSTTSSFELKRREANGDKTAGRALHRETLLGDVFSLQRILSALLLVIFVALSVATFGWFLGIILALLVALEYGAVARLASLHHLAQQLYQRYEQGLLEYIERFAGIFRFLRNVVPEPSTLPKLDSREELQYLVTHSENLLSGDEKKLIVHGLQFGSRAVSEVMTPSSVIDSVSKKELLGPLVLDDLHKTGHSRFPVTEGDIDHVIGMLHIQSLLSLHAKRSLTAEKAMEPRVFYIREAQTLQHALAAFLRTRHHLFIVVNEFRETVGLLSLEDVIEALLGRKIIDEFDMHDDLRAVAMRNPRGNNYPEKREDV